MARKPQYKRHKASGRARTQYRGKRIYLPGPYGSPESKRAYDDIIAQWHADHAKRKLEAAPATPAEQTAMAELMLQWTKWAEGTMPATELAHYKRLLKLVAEMHARLNVREFGPRRLMEVREALVKRPKVGGGVISYKYVNAQITRLVRVFGWGVHRELVPPEVHYALKQVPPLKPREAVDGVVPSIPPKVEEVPWETVKPLLCHLTPTLADMVRVHWLAGMRSSEVCRLRKREIEFEDFAPEWLYKPSAHKTAYRGKLKLIFFGPIARDLLAPRLTRYPAGYLFRPADSRQEQLQRQFGTTSKLKARFRERYHSESYGHAITKAIKKARRKRAEELIQAGLCDEDAQSQAEAEFPHWSPHQLRHGRATQVRETWGVEGAAAITGNTVAASQIYAQRNVKLAREIVREIG